jgi:MFS family permease
VSATTSPSKPIAKRPTHFRRNVVWFTVDYVLFAIGQAFLNQSTVLPSFVSQLTASAFLVGLVTTVQSGAWLLPQLFAASLVAGRRRKWPFMMKAALVGRPFYLILAALTLAVGAEQPTLLLLTLYLTLAAFGICDGLVSVPWFDILSKTIPPDVRGRLLGFGQIAGGLIGVVLGGVVALILAQPGLPFPNNYALLFGLAGVAYVLDLLALGLIRESDGPATEVKRSPGQFFRLLLPTLREDHLLRRVVIVRLFYGAGVLVFPFYIVFARQELGFGAEDVGLFLSAQVFGGVLGGFLFGQLADHRGTRTAIRAAVALATVSPAMALICHFARPALGPALIYATAVVFVGIGLSFSAYLLGFMNHVLEVARPEDRSTYAGLFNTINGTLLVIPALAGTFLQVTSFTALFGTSLVLLLLAGIASTQLGEPRG